MSGMGIKRISGNKVRKFIYCGFALQRSAITKDAYEKFNHMKKKQKAELENLEIRVSMRDGQILVNI